MESNNEFMLQHININGQQTNQVAVTARESGLVENENMHLIRWIIIDL